MNNIVTWLNQLVIIVSLGLSLPALAQINTIGTGSPGGTYYPLGTTLAKIWSKHIPNLTIRAEVTKASVENVLRVSTHKQLVGLAMGNVALKAYQGKPPFPRKMPINVLFALYPNVVHLIVPIDSTIQSLSDLKGKRISLGPPGSGTRMSAVSILNAVDINETDIEPLSLNHSATINAIANGQIDGAFIMERLGARAMTKLALAHTIRILSFSDANMEKINAADPSYQSFHVPDNRYADIPAFTTPAIRNVVVTHHTMDKALAYQMTKIAFEHIDELRDTTAVSQFLSAKNIGIPLHPGAQAYLDEQAK